MSNDPPFDCYRIVPCSCVCGGNIAWVGIRPSGAEEMIGCVCHQTPVELVGRLLNVTSWLPLSTPTARTPPVANDPPFINPQL